MLRLCGLLIYLALFPLCQAWAAESISPEEISVLAKRVTRDMIELVTDCALVGLTVYVQDGQVIGLSEESIETAARSRLRSARLYKDPPIKVGGVLRIDVLLLPGSRAYTYRMWFEKQQLDTISRIRDWSPSGWEQWIVGEHVGDSNAILSDISQDLDRFLDDYLRANEPACEPESSEWRAVTLEEMGLPADYNPFPDE